MSSENNKLIELFGSNEFVGLRKIIISSAGTSMRNNLKQYVGPYDVLYTEVLPNPSLKQLIEFFKLVKLKEKDIVIGIGGGSVIDFSKLVALFACTPINEIKSIIESARYDSIQRALKLVAIPTLFGSGAEQTPFAVCYIGNKKYSVANDWILPLRVEYIPEINLSAPTSTKLANVLDCFCQAAESLTARNANSLSVEYAERTLRLLVPIAKEYIEGNSIDLAAKMAEASSLCGKAISISKTTGPHAMSYFLTANLGWKHGIAVGFVFTFFLEKYKPSITDNVDIQRLFNVLDDILLSDQIIQYFASLGLNMRKLVSHVNSDLDFSNWVSSVNLERLGNGPDINMSWLNEKDLMNFYKSLVK